MPMEISAFVRIAIYFCLGTVALCCGACAQSSEIDDVSHGVFKSRGDFWVILPASIAPSAVPDRAYASIGYALYFPEQIDNGVCVTRMVAVGFLHDDGTSVEIIGSSVPSDSSYYVAFRGHEQSGDCQSLDFEKNFFQLAQPIDTTALVELSKLISVIAVDDRATMASAGRSLEGLQIAKISVSYSGTFGDLVYRVSLRDEDGLVLFAQIGNTRGHLQILDIGGLAE